MAVTFNHTIIHARDKEQSARFLSAILGLPSHQTMEPFAVVQVGETSFDLIETDGDIDVAMPRRTAPT